MVTDVLPLRAVILQCLLLTIAIAIEAVVLFRLLKIGDNQTITPKQSVQYAASINLLSTVLGWFTIFSFFNLEASLPSEWTRNLETALLNFIFFNQFSNQSLSLLIVVGFVTFFISFIVKQVGLWGLHWLLQLDFSQIEEPAEPEQRKTSIPRHWARYLGSEMAEAESQKASIVGIRDLRKEPRSDNQLNISAVLFANAWSYSAILLILLILNL